jgi:hypothetical protein
MSPARPRRFAAVLVPAIALSLLCAGGARAAPHLDGSFEVPGVETNNKLVAGPDGNMWVTVSNGENDVARITPGGKVDEFELTGVEGATGIAVDAKGTMWVTTNKGVASFSVSDPKGTSQATDLGLTSAEAIVAGPDGNMWVAASEKVIHFPPSSPATTTTLSVPELMPKDIDVAGSLIAVSDSNGNKKRIVTFTTAGNEKAFEIPGGSQGLAGAPGGQIAFSAAGATPEQSGLITPPNPAQSFELTGDPFGVAYGADKAFWIVQFAPGVLERVTPDGAHTSTVTGLPQETARQIAPGPGNTLWVTIVEKLNVAKPSVARISGVEQPKEVKEAPNTTLAKGPKVFRTHHRTARVRFRFSASVKGATFRMRPDQAPERQSRRQTAQAPFQSLQIAEDLPPAPGLLPLLGPRGRQRPSRPDPRLPRLPRHPRARAQTPPPVDGI